MRPGRVVGALAALVVVGGLGGVLLLVSCDRTPGPSITAAQARAKVQQRLQETLRDVTTPLRFTEEQLPDFERQGGSSCTRGWDQQTGQVRATIRYQATEVWPIDTPAPDTVRQHLDAVQAYWRSRGYQVQREGFYVNADLSDDSYLHTSYFGGRVRLGGSSACVWPNATPAPG